MFTANTVGARLAYVVREIPGTVKREVFEMVETKKAQYGKKATHEMKKVLKDVPAGYMVYFPRGHAMRIPNKKTLEFYGLDKPARIINAENILADPNSPLARMMTEQTEQGRMGAKLDVERMTIQMAVSKTGPIVQLEQVQEVA